MIKVKKQKLKQRINVDLRQRQKIVQRRIIFSSLILTCSTLIYITFHLGSVKEAQAAPLFYTITNGEWSDKAVWSKASNAGLWCNCEPGNNYNGPGIQIGHSIISNVYNPLKISGGGIINISSSGKLEIIGAFELNGTSTVNIQNSDSVIINGNLTVSGGSVINTGSSGYLVVYGNVTLSGGSKVVGPAGRVNATGTVTGAGWQASSLPIQLIDFRAKPEAGTVVLTWSTATEKDNDYFTIERSADGKNFEEIFKRPGAGTSNNILNYTGSDIKPLKGINYYRLKQTDFNGQFAISKIVSLNNNVVNVDEEISFISVSPNPFKDQVSLNFSILKKGNVALKIFNDQGNCVLERAITAEKGINSYLINDSTDFPNGIYFVNLDFNGNRVSRKIIKI